MPTADSGLPLLQPALQWSMPHLRRRRHGVPARRRRRAAQPAPALTLTPRPGHGTQALSKRCKGSSCRRLPMRPCAIWKGIGAPRRSKAACRAPPPIPFTFASPGPSERVAQPLAGLRTAPRPTRARALPRSPRPLPSRHAALARGPDRGPAGPGGRRLGRWGPGAARRRRLTRPLLLPPCLCLAPRAA